MAQQQGKVYLGYEEEAVSERNQTLLHYTVNKIGGFPVRHLKCIESAPQPSRIEIATSFLLFLGLAPFGKFEVSTQVPFVRIAQNIDYSVLCTFGELCLPPHTLCFRLHQPQLLDTV